MRRGGGGTAPTRSYNTAKDCTRPTRKAESVGVIPTVHKVIHRTPRRQQDDRAGSRSRQDTLAGGSDKKICRLRRIVPKIDGLDGRALSTVYSLKMLYVKRVSRDSYRVLPYVPPPLLERPAQTPTVFLRHLN